jgi:hypothetical protein
MLRDAEQLGETVAECVHGICEIVEINDHLLGLLSHSFVEELQVGEQLLRVLKVTVHVTVDGHCNSFVGTAEMVEFGDLLGFF